LNKNNKEIVWGAKTIKISLNLFTNNLETDDLKTAWECGLIHLNANKHRGIKHDSIHFRNLRELMPRLQQLLTKNNITLRASSSKAIPEAKWPTE